MITDPKEIRFHLEKAFYLASSGRPGPVWLDIPADVQMSKIKVDELKPFVLEDSKSTNDSFTDDIEAKALELVQMLKNSKRPIVHIKAMELN